MKAAWGTSWLLLGILLCSGCLGLSSSRTTPSLYLIDHPMTLLPAVPDSLGTLPYRVRVRDVQFPRVLDRSRIVYRYSPNQLNYYRYHQWAVPPRTMVSDMVAKHVATAGIFEEVRREFVDEQPDLEIRGDLHALERFESGTFGGAHLAMALRLQRRSDGQVLAYHEFDREVRLHSASMVFFAQTISRMLEEETATFLQRMWSSFGVGAVLPGVTSTPADTTAVESGYRLVPIPPGRQLPPPGESP